MTSARAAANRTVLAAAGLALLGGGIWLATARASIADRLPGGWPAPAPDAVLLDRGTLADLRARNWWTPAVITAGVLATVLLAWWLFGQIHPRHRARLQLASPHGTLRTRAFEEALAERAVTIDGISRCRARLYVRRRRLQLHLRVWLDAGTAPGTVIEQLAAVSREAGPAAAPYEIGTFLRMNHVTHQVPHVR
ncbi:hypothetical protein [Streptomyces sp. MBT27]|uniref:hypothetical protein n=1 Tax=Streptomyces sp. MBT27 TaxID=1488356 RepID=UPI00141E1CBF|nr:hypothetical protein [Streptomyces sp. MBT27]